MDIALSLLMVVVLWRVLSLRYQRARINLLGQHLASLQLERHMETLTQGYTRAIQADDETRQIQVLETFIQTERSVAAQIQSLADIMQKESAQATSMGVLPFCVPYAERFFPALTRDFRELLRILQRGDRLRPAAAARRLLLGGDPLRHRVGDRHLLRRARRISWRLRQGRGR